MERPSDQKSELDSIRAELAALRSEVAALEARQASGSPLRAIETGREPPTAVTGRREMLKRAGAVTAAAAAAGAALALGDATPAAAANGDPIAIGAANAGSNSYTTLNVSAASGDGGLLTVQEGNSWGPTTSDHPAAVSGWANGNLRAGLYGWNLGTHSVGSPKYGGVLMSLHGDGMLVGGSHSAMKIQNTGSTPQGRADQHYRGELIVDAGGTLWYCTASGTPGTWRRLSGTGANAAGSLTILPSTVRCYDSRPASPPAGGGTKGPLGGAVTRLIDTTNNSTGVPAGATAVLVNLTATNTSAAGFLALFKAGVAWPGNSSINWDHAGQSIANLAVVAVDATDRIAAYCATGAFCDFIIDVIGYYQ